MFFKPNKQSIQSFFSSEQQQALQESIRLAELNTSGEIRIHIDALCKTADPKDQALIVFEQLKMHETELRNGVLFYLAVESKQFAIIGDEGINSAVPSDFWDQIRDVMKQNFMNHQFTEGLTLGIEMAGKQLKAFFPLQENDSNELSNDLSFGDIKSDSTND